MLNTEAIVIREALKEQFPGIKINTKQNDEMEVTSLNLVTPSIRTTQFLALHELIKEHQFEISFKRSGTGVSIYIEG